MCARKHEESLHNFSGNCISTGDTMSILIAPICKNLVSQTHKKRSSKRSGNVLAANRLLGAPVHPLDNFLELEERHLSALRRYHGMKTHYNSMKLVAFQLKCGFPGLWGTVSYLPVELLSGLLSPGRARLKSCRILRRSLRPGSLLRERALCRQKGTVPSPKGQSRPSQEMATSDFKDDTHSR